MKPKQKITRILGITGWSKDHLADLLDISNMTLGRWLKGRSIPYADSQAHIDAMYDGIVKPLECEIDRLADGVEKKILKAKILKLDDDNCSV